MIEDFRDVAAEVEQGEREGRSRDARMKILERLRLARLGAETADCEINEALGYETIWDEELLDLYNKAIDLQADIDNALDSIRGWNE